MNSAVAQAIAAVPSTHLGLEWGHHAGTGEISSLVRRCEAYDSIIPGNPEPVISVLFSAGPLTTVLVGRDSSGTLRAVATVRWNRPNSPGTAALRAHIDPRWRDRGIGRAVLAWQDQVALKLLESGHSRRIGVTIPSGLVDRRRLYTAAGFSSHGRVEAFVRSLTDPPEDDLVVPSGVEILPLDVIADDSVLRSQESSEDFIATGLLSGESLDTANKHASHVACRDSGVIGAVIVHDSVGEQGESVALISDMRSSGCVDRGLLSAVFRVLSDQGTSAVHFRVTPESLSSWDHTLLSAGAESSGAYVVYSIEWP